jgi:NADPH:quinone reductase-like Zn-dependent oxidoreductase
MKKILILGGSGGIGKGVVELMSKHHEIIAVGSNDFNIKNIKE